MTNRELQDLLKQYPDDMEVEIFQWDRDIPFEIENVCVEECPPHYIWDKECHQGIVLK